MGSTEPKRPIPSTALVAGIVDEQYVYAVNVTGYPQLAYSIVAPPSGMTGNDKSGTISWIPPSSSDGKVTVRPDAGSDFQADDNRIAGLVPEKKNNFTNRKNYGCRSNSRVAR